MKTTTTTHTPTGTKEIELTRTSKHIMTGSNPGGTPVQLRIWANEGGDIGLQWPVGADGTDVPHVHLTGGFFENGAYMGGTWPNYDGGQEELPEHVEVFRAAWEEVKYASHPDGLSKEFIVEFLKSGFEVEFSVEGDVLTAQASPENTMAETIASVTRRLAYRVYEGLWLVYECNGYLFAELDDLEGYIRQVRIR